MTTQHVERTAAEPTTAPTARRIVDALPVSNSDIESVKNLIAEDRPEPENKLVRVVLTAMTWMLYVVALGVVVLLLRAMTTGYLAK